MNIEDELEVLKLTAMSTLDSGERLRPTLSVLRKQDKRRVTFFLRDFGDDDAKQKVFTEAFAGASLFNPETLIFASDSFVGKAANGVRPSEDPDARECLMIQVGTLGGLEVEMSMTMLPYSRDDQGKLNWGESKIMEGKSEGLVPQLMEAAIRHSIPVDDPAVFITALLKAGHNMVALDA